ncbi:MAG: MFS transporter, partial [Melioribacteraceae bacterium]|nr:MFS transporter [Melioribacteraceae bacterium]
LGIYLRVFSFLGVALTLYAVESTDPLFIIYAVFGWMFIFSVSGAFAGVSYTDILGKSNSPNTRKRFFVTRQFLNSIGILISALIVRGILKEIQYPNNYIYMFTAASALLFIAAMGFLSLKERPSVISKVPKKFTEVLKSIPTIMKSDSNLRNLVISVNLLSVSFTMIRFYISLVKSQSELNKEVIGNFLLFQIIGMILSNFIWIRYTKNKGFKGMFKMTAILYGALPILALLFVLFLPMEYFGIVFFLIGASMSAYKISSESILIEISDENNRPLYSGIYGTLNLTMALFPLIIALLISNFGFSFVFIISSLLTFSALIFLNKMVCPVDTKES